MNTIPEKWIVEYVDKLLVLAKEFEPGAMRDACALRADHALDLIEAWRVQKGKKQGG